MKRLLYSSNKDTFDVSGNQQNEILKIVYKKIFDHILHRNTLEHHECICDDAANTSKF